MSIRIAQNRRGSATLVAIFMLMVCSAICFAVMSQANMASLGSANHQRTVTARLTAESGMSFMLRCLDSVSMPYDTTMSNVLPRMAGDVSSFLSPNLAGRHVTQDALSVHVPGLASPNGMFSATVTKDATANLLYLKVTGQTQDVTRAVQMQLLLVPHSGTIFNYGVASRGRITITGNATIEGTHDAHEADILSTRTEPVAIQAGGSANISGDLSVTAQDPDYVKIKGGGLSIGGSSDINDIIQDHVHLGVQEPDFPAISTSAFAAMATTVITPGTKITHTTYENICIAPGTNPSFSSDTVINGVLYIQAPNKVTFSGGVTINGIIVTQDGSALPISGNQIEFRGHCAAPGVEALPNDQKWANLRSQTGSIILAPGFGVTFKGATNTINGTIAADQLSFIGNANVGGAIDGSISGFIIGLKDLEMTLSGSAHLRLSGSTANKTPAGFLLPVGLAVVPTSYQEVASD